MPEDNMPFENHCSILEKGQILGYRTGNCFASYPLTLNYFKESSFNLPPAYNNVSTYMHAKEKGKAKLSLCLTN
jgi:hypothetical protein